MTERLVQLYDSIGVRDLIEISILSLLIYGILRFIGRTRGASMVRGLGILVAGFVLLLQVIIVSFDFTELTKILDYLLTAVLLSLVIIFQPELRRGILVLGRYRMFQVFGREQDPFVERLGDAAELLSREHTGALIVIQRSVSLQQFLSSGEALDAEVSVGLLRAIFNKHSPLHDGAVIICDGRIAAAACQLPLAEAPVGKTNFGMRHRAALGVSEETDAIVLIVSEETGRVSLATAGALIPIPREQVATRLAGAFDDAPRAMAA